MNDQQITPIVETYWAFKDWSIARILDPNAPGIFNDSNYLMQFLKEVGKTDMFVEVDSFCQYRDQTSYRHYN